MKVLAFTDFHGNRDAYERAKKQILNEKPDLVVVAGDILNHDVAGAKQCLLDLATAGSPVYFVPGNMDGEDLSSWTGEGLVNGLHGRGKDSAGVFLIGLGGSPHGPFRTVFEYSEEEAKALLQAASEEYKGGKLILVSHCPPKNTSVDKISSGEHVGSMAVRKFVEKMQPDLVISGHVHEATGTDKIGRTTVVNTGPAQRGNYAQIILDDKITVKFAKLF